jgi:hypothetical protein
MENGKCDVRRRLELSGILQKQIFINVSQKSTVPSTSTATKSAYFSPEES